MTNHLSQIIGQDKEINPQIDQAKSQVLATIHKRINLVIVMGIKAPFKQKISVSKP